MLFLHVPGSVLTSRMCLCVHLAFFACCSQIVRIVIAVNLFFHSLHVRFVLLFACILSRSLSRIFLVCFSYLDRIVPCTFLVLRFDVEHSTRMFLICFSYLARICSFVLVSAIVLISQ